MSELETNGYITCASCNTINKLHEIGEQGFYHCGTCKNPLIFINKEKPKSNLLKTLVIAGMIGVAGSIGINQIKEALRPAEINYANLDTNWSRSQIVQFEAKCKASLVKDKPRWNADRIDKTCTCFTTYIVEKIDFSNRRSLDSEIITKGAKECT